MTASPRVRSVARKSSLTINRPEIWTITDCDGDMVASFSDGKPDDEQVAMEILLYDHPTCSPFILGKLERVGVWEYEPAVINGKEQTTGKAYKIFGSENKPIAAPVVLGKRKVTIR